MTRLRTKRTVKVNNIEVPTENPDMGKYGKDVSPDSEDLIAIGGTKYDGGKIMGGIMYEYFPRALYAVGEVATFGAKKYSRGGWLHVPNALERYTDALHRHLLDDAKGILNDEDSKLSHKAHAAWNALAILELTLRELEKE